MTQYLNEQVKKYIKDEIYVGLIQLPDGWITKFKRMYSPKDLTVDLKTIINNLPEEKLNWALTQVQNSLKKLAK